MKRPKSVTWAFVPADWFIQAQAGPLQYQQRATPLDALDVARGDTCWCLYDGDLAWSINATMILHAFACDMAEEALQRRNVTDERSWKAIKVKRQWMAGQASDSELDAARAAARAAAGAAAGAAAWAAARDAAWAAARDAAWDAAWDAARDAAWDAAWAAAWDAAWAAARDAAWDAAWAAARDAAWAAANRRLLRMLRTTRHQARKKHALVSA